MRNFTKRCFIAQDEPWWDNVSSDWKLTIEHPYAPAESAVPDNWMDRALDLCENELTHQYFGLGLMDLLELDPSTFEKIEKRVYEFSQRQSERLKTIAPNNQGAHRNA